MLSIAAIAKHPVSIALVAALALAGCANKQVPNSAADIGLGGAGGPPGSQQEFTERRQQLSILHTRKEKPRWTMSARLFLLAEFERRRRQPCAALRMASMFFA